MNPGPEVFAAVLGLYEQCYVIRNIRLLMDLGSNFHFTEVRTHTCNNCGILKSLFLYGTYFKVFFLSGSLHLNVLDQLVV